jgi:hypothetical protein
MNRRKDGRELYEVFKEQMAAVSQPGASKEAAVFRPEPKVSPIASDMAMHTVRLGDRRQVEVFLSMTWVYGLIFFVLLLVVAAFMVGRHFAPPPEQIEAIDAPPSFATHAGEVGDAKMIVPAPERPMPAGPQAPNRPASVTQPPAPASTVEVSSGGMYTFAVSTYRSKGTNKALADETVKALKDMGLPDVRLLNDKAHGNLVVAVGSFATKDDPEAAKLKARLAKTSYKGSVFKDVYMTTLKGYE